MGFRQDAYAKVWTYEDKGNYGMGQVSISKKNKTTGQYEVEFQDGYVRFVGSAHDLMNENPIPERGGLSIKISSCDVTNNYSKEKKKTYTNYVIFGFELPDGNPAPKKEAPKAAKPAETNSEVDSFAEAEDDLPF